MSNEVAVQGEAKQVAIVRDAPPPAQVPAKESDPYAGIAAAPVTDEQKHILLEDIPDEALDVKPTGEVYASQVRYRNILNRAFGPMAWALRPMGPLQMKEGILYQEYALYVNGRFVSQSIGAQEYYADNRRMTYADAAEAAKSNALTRCCKDLGIAAKCWERRVTQKFLEENCVKVMVRDRRGQVKHQWRRKDAPPFEGEGAEGAGGPRIEHIERDDQPQQNAGDAIVATQARKQGIPISEAQSKRMYAIARSKGFSNEELHDVLGRYGYEHSKDVLRSDYEAICAEFEKAV